MIVNPNFYMQQYVDSREGDVGRSDISKQLTADLVMQNSQWNIDNAWYDAHLSAGAKYDEFRDLGVNPYSAVRAAIGQPSQQSPSSAPSVTATGADSAAQTALNALGTTVDSIASGVQTDLSRQQTHSNVALQDSQTANNIAQNPYIGPKAKAEIGKLESEAIESEAHAGALNAQQQKFISEANLDDKQAKQIEQVMSRYDEVTTAQINNWQNQATLYFEQAKTSAKERVVMDADIALKGDMGSYYREAATESYEHSRWYNADTGRLKSINEFVAETGVPLDADNLSTLNYYESKGDYDGAQRYFNCIMDCAASREAGVQSQSLPADRARYNAQEGVKYYFHIPSNVREGLFKGGFYHYPTIYNPNFKPNPSLHHFQSYPFFRY